MCPYLCAQARATECLPLESRKMVPPGAMQFHVAAYLTALGLATTHLFIPSMSILIPFLHAFPSIWNFLIFHLPCSSAFFSCQLNRTI